MVYDIGYYLTLLGDQSAKKLSPQGQKSCNQFHKKNGSCLSASIVLF